MRQKSIEAFRVLIPCVFSILIFGQSNLYGGILLNEGFETDGMDSRYFVIGNFSDGTDDYFTRTDGFTEASGIPDYTEFTGSYFWAAEDIDATENEVGMAILEFSSISLSNFPAIEISLDIGAGSDSAFDSVDDFLMVQYRELDGPWQTALSFQNNGQVYNGALFQDTDLDGIGDGIQLGLSLQTISSTMIPVTGSSIDLRIDTLMTSGSEAIAFDNVQVVGVPEPNAVALIFGLLSLVFIFTRHFLLIRRIKSRA